MQIHEITKRQLEEGILGDLKAEVTKQATQAYTQAKQGIQKFRADPKAAIKSAGARLTQGAEKAYQRYATPAGQLQGQNQKNAISADKSANQLITQFGSPLLKTFASSYPDALQPLPPEEKQAEAPAVNTQQAQQTAPMTPMQQTLAAQKKQMSPASGIKEAKRNRGQRKSKVAKVAQNVQPQNQAPQADVSTGIPALDKFKDDVNDFVGTLANPDQIKQLPTYGKEYLTAIDQAVDAKAHGNIAVVKQALTKAFGIAKLAALKLKKEQGDGEQQTQQTSTGRTSSMTDKQVDQAIAAIKQVSGGAKGNRTGIQPVDNILAKAGVLGEGKQ